MGPEISVAHFVNFWIFREINCCKLEAQKLPIFIGFEFLLWKGFSFKKFLGAGIQDVSTSISIVLDLIERSPDGDGDESDKHI